MRICPRAISSVISCLLLSWISGISPLSAGTTAAADKIHVVVGEGSAPLAESTIDKARRIAVSKALNDGVLQSITILISPELAAKAAADIQAHILPGASRYIRDFRINQENEEDGRYSVRLQATIDAARLRADLSRLTFHIRTSFGPPALLMLVEQNDVSRTPCYWWDVSRPIEEVLTNSFWWLVESYAQRGFRTIDSEEALQEARRRGPALPPDLSDEDAAEMGKALGASVVILSHIEVRQKAGKSCKAMMWSRVVAVDSRQVLAQKDSEQDVESENVDWACEEAFRRCSIQTLDSLQGIVSAWYSAHPDTISIELALKGVPNYSYFLQIQRIFTDRIPELQFMDFFSIEGGIYHTEVRFHGPMQYLAHRLESAVYGEFDLEVEKRGDKSLMLYVQMPESGMGP